MNLIETALARVILEKNKPEITNAMKVFTSLYKFKELNEFEIAEFAGLELIEAFNAIDFLHQRNLITFKKGKYLIPDLMESMNRLIEIDENQKLEKNAPIRLNA